MTCMYSVLDEHMRNTCNFEYILLAGLETRAIHETNSLLDLGVYVIPG